MNINDPLYSGPFFSIMVTPFPGSSMVERLPVKERVVGSNPTRGAKKDDVLVLVPS